MTEYESDPGRRELGEYVELQRTVVPVVSWEEDRFRPQGSAVSIGVGGWFITAKHVLEDPQRRRPCELQDGRAGLFIIWEFNEPLPNGDVRAKLVPVLGLDEHPTADLALLSVQTEVDGETISFPANRFAARMPNDGEELRGFGYPRTAMTGRAPIHTAAIVGYARRLAESSGHVIDRHPVRRDSSGINFPAVMTNAHDEHGMSGGPVVDSDGVILGVISRGMRPDVDGGDWVSYVSLIGPGLQLAGLLATVDGAEEPVKLGQLVMNGEIDFEMYDSFEVIDGPAGINVHYTLDDDSDAG